MDREKLVKIGKIISAHGVRGLVKIKSYAEKASDLSKYGKIYNSSGNIIELKIKSVNKDILIGSIEDINSVEEAEPMLKTDLYIYRTALPQLKEDDFYVQDLSGMNVTDDKNNHIGNILDVQNFGSGDLLEIHFLKDNKSEYIPFTKKYFPTVDLVRRIIIMRNKLL
jgi:16S rRNA processing protein RimM